MKKLIVIALIGLLVTTLAGKILAANQEATPTLKTQSQSIKL